jgi:hypothetical protein
MFEAVGAYTAGKINEDQLCEFERKVCPTCGSCSGMYTANSMNCLTEVLGMGLRGNGTIPAVYSSRIELAKHAGMQVMELVKKNVRPRDIMTAAAIKNAINNGNIFSDGVIINAYIGGIIAVMSGTTSIRSVVNNGEVKMTSGNGASGTRYVGGATGAITGTNSAVSIVDFTMNNNILCDGYAGGRQVGGVAGTAQGSTIFNTITVNGDVLVNGANVMYVGGIVGEFKLGNTNNFANCTVNGH